MEPYFPHRFARNFGYDQAVPPNADFALPDRTYRGLDRHLVASSWWCFFIRRDPSQELFIPEQRRDGRVDILYAQWWTRHNKAFRERADVVKAAEGAYLSRAGASISSITSKFLRREFPELAGKVSTVGRRRAKAQVIDPTERKARVEALEPLVRPEGSSATSRGSGEPPLVYFWWRHFLLDCGYQSKRRASREVGSSQPGARGRTPEPSASVGGGEPSLFGLPARGGFRPLFPFPPDRGYVPGGASAGGDTVHQAVSISSLQKIHSLLVSGPGGELPSFSNFAPGLLEGGTLPRALHCAMTVTSPAVLPVRSPLKEGEVLERTVGEDDGQRGTSSLTLVLIHFVGGVEIVAKMMEMGPLVAVFPPVATQARGKDAPCGVMTAPLLSGPSEPLTAADDNVPQQPFAAASPVGFAPFPSHDVLWPSEPQSIQMEDNGGVLETLMGLTRSAMEESSPPCLERVRGFLYRNTLAYHLMGYPRDPWMAAVDAIWDEVKRRCQEATRLKIQELSAEIALAEQRFEALRLQRGGVVSRVETLRAGCAQCHADIMGIQRTIEEASTRLADSQVAYRALTEGAAEAEAAATALEQEFADSQTRLSTLQASLADLRGGPHASS
ncbi:hypothetical protein Taro_011955 [Colocasia esculenta]|uniref:Uncharacterized protein n=1 Tax=Colocasia esculenta TaxID=4460 RepID=A0A843UCC9_COLES|nr:hypothetical protein [Colocasia esculenta]